MEKTLKNEQLCKLFIMLAAHCVCVFLVHVIYRVKEYAFPLQIDIFGKLEHFGWSSQINNNHVFALE